METVTHGARTPPAPTFPVETFTDAERARLEPHFTNLDLPVFGLVNLPETVKGALFARYSRYPGTLRRLFLDEFADSVPEVPSIEGSEGERAAALYDRIFVGYGDDSVAQLGGAHIACEWTSNLLTKILQRPRLASYLEQSTRYIAYDTQIDGFGYRYHRDPRFGAEYERALDGLFATYTRLLEGTEAWVAGQFPRGADESAAAHARAVRAKALDLVRGILPAASLSHMGIYASGQTYEQLVLHLLAHPLAEAQTYGELLLQELRKIIPSFVARVPRPDRGGRWIEYLRERRHAAEAGAERLGLVGAEDGGAGTGVPSVTLLRVHGTEEELAAALLFESSGVGESEALDAISRLGATERAALLRGLVGARENRRHRPGRGFETLRYRFEIVSDYGAFRDLQRHRLLTCQWQRLSPDLGADVPHELAAAGLAGDYARALESSRAEYERLRDAGFVEEAPYALSLAFRIRYVLELDAREALHLIELRSGREGHPSYRAVAHEMLRAIAAVHPNVAAAMSFVDDSREERLERLLSEMRNESRPA
ncbi:MAG TPA: FAD-dependent thymidylate synthase [Gaiellaceae bacterium]|nr:FAD-dependent thymidylate synthase [Gaiellaceae bacterium]